MNTKSLALLAMGAGCALLITTTAVRSQDAEPMDASAMAAMAPGPMHAHLAQLAGEWNVTGKWRMQSDEEWMPFEGEATSALILGGRQLSEKFTSELMGMSFEGRCLTGYDNMRNEYVSVWVDNMSTGTMVSTGTANEDGSEITLVGEQSDPMSGEAHKWFKVRYTVKDPDHNVFESFTKSTPDGDEWVSMVLNYARK